MTGKQPVTCARCDYEWDYTGEQRTATCPNCLTTVVVGEQESGPEPITVAGDDGEVIVEIDVPPGAEIDRSDDGAITSIVTPEDKWEILVAKDTEFGAKVHRMAAERDQTAEQFVLDALSEYGEGVSP